MTKLQGCCIDCGRKYGDEYGFPDLVVPDEAWKRLSPTGDTGGLLCPSCLCRRAHDAGVECEARFASGPFRPQEPRAKTLDDIRAFKVSLPPTSGGEDCECGRVHVSVCNHLNRRGDCQNMTKEQIA